MGGRGRHGPCMGGTALACAAGVARPLHARRGSARPLHARRRRRCVGGYAPRILDYAPGESVGRTGTIGGTAPAHPPPNRVAAYAPASAVPAKAQVLPWGTGVAEGGGEPGCARVAVPSVTARPGKLLTYRDIHPGNRGVCSCKVRYRTYAGRRSLWHTPYCKCAHGASMPVAYAISRR